MRLKRSIISICALGAALAGCDADGSVWYPFTQTPPPTLTVEDPADVKYFPSDEPLHLALEHFNRGHYGIAARYFEDAVEKTPKDATAWVGLAASYDRIGRFDLADRAYAAAIRLTGPTVQILNNQGYSYLLRGDLRNARRRFLKAYELEPNNPTIINNLALLNSSGKFVRRTDDP
jgi:Flp pilus assembly protein TadD